MLEDCTFAGSALHVQVYPLLLLSHYAERLRLQTFHRTISLFRLSICICSAHTVMDVGVVQRSCYHSIILKLTYKKKIYLMGSYVLYVSISLFVCVPLKFLKIILFYKARFGNCYCRLSRHCLLLHY
jgi:hypothetical protein